MNIYAESSAVLAWLFGEPTGEPVRMVLAKVLDRASRPFPNEPIRTLDALHLSSALLARSVVSGLAILSIDERIRTNAHRLGFDLVPD